MWVAFKRFSLGIFLIAVAAAILLISDVGHRRPAQRRMPRIALLQHVSQPMIDEGVQGLLDGLAAQGLVDGRTVQIQRFNAEGDLATANTIAKALTGDNYDLLLTATTLSLQAVAAANVSTHKRHVFALVSDPAGAGVGISRDEPLKHPPYMAGYGTLQPVAETFRLARRMFPELRTVGVAWNTAESNSEANVKLARAICSELGIDLQEATVDGTGAVRDATASLASRGVEAIWIGGDVTVLTAIDAVIATARSSGIPVFTSMPGSTKRGALFDLGANYHEVGRIAAELAARILNGADPAAVPIENVMPERLLLNRDALSGLNQAWTIPDDVAKRAAQDSVAKGNTPSTAAAAAMAVGKQWQLDLLEYINAKDVEDCEAGIHAGLRDNGLIEGRDFALRIRNAQGDMPALSSLVDAALADGSDLLFTLSTPTLQAAMQRTRTIPIVFTFVADAIAAGAGTSNTQHRDNVTGVPTTSSYDELLDALQECVPQARRIGTLFVPAEVNSVYNKDHLASAAKARGLELITVAADTSAEISDATLSLLSRDIDAIAQVGSNVTAAGFATISQPAQRAHIPVFGFLSADLANGAVLVIARDYFDGGHAAAQMAVDVMRGKSPQAIPFMPLSTTRLLINLEAARATGLVIPQRLQERAFKQPTATLIK